MICNRLKFKRQLRVFTQQIECHPMIRSCSSFTDSCPMLLGRIPLVLIPIVEWIFLMQGIHIVITIRLCQDRSRCNGKVFTVSFYHRSMRQVLVFLETVSIYQQMLRTYLQLVDRPMHGQERSIQYIDFINFLGSDDTHRPSYRLTIYHLTQQVTLPFRQLLGIIQ